VGSPKTERFADISRLLSARDDLEFESLRILQERGVVSVAVSTGLASRPGMTIFIEMPPAVRGSVVPKPVDILPVISVESQMTQPRMAPVVNARTLTLLENEYTPSSFQLRPPSQD
jgi:hypothetical protein